VKGLVNTQIVALSIAHFLLQISFFPGSGINLMPDDKDMKEGMEKYIYS
jgi:hypothetical protein